MINCYKLSYSCSKKRLNDLIHKGLEYEKEHNIKQPEKETLLVKKDQRIAELEKANKTAVKEFADEFKKLCFNYGEFDDILCYRNNACELIDRLLKERGIE